MYSPWLAEYVLDLNDVRFSEPLIRQFVGNVCVLSVQKFSSNVIEKVNNRGRPPSDHVILVCSLTRASSFTVHPCRRPRAQEDLGRRTLEPRPIRKVVARFVCQLRRSDRFGLRRSCSTNGPRRSYSTHPSHDPQHALRQANPVEAAA